MLSATQQILARQRGAAAPPAWTRDRPRRRRVMGCGLLAGALVIADVGITLLMVYAIGAAGRWLTEPDRAGLLLVAFGGLVGAVVWSLIVAHQISVYHGRRGHLLATAAVLLAWLHLVGAVAATGLGEFTTTASVGTAWLAVLNAAVPLPAVHCVRNCLSATGRPPLRTPPVPQSRPAGSGPRWADLLVSQPVSAGSDRPLAARIDRTARHRASPVMPPASPQPRRDAE
jgi:hypothetical protein